MLQHSQGPSLGHSVAPCTDVVNLCLSCILNCFMISAAHKDDIFQIMLYWMTTWDFDWSVLVEPV